VLRAVNNLLVYAQTDNELYYEQSTGLLSEQNIAAT
jgi:hypothetical protein